MGRNHYGVLIVAVVAGTLGFAVAAHAQQALDPRLAAPAVQVLQGQVTFLEAQLRVQREDSMALVKKLCDAIPEDKRKDQPDCPAKAAEAK